jgi:hypothetical protein
VNVFLIDDILLAPVKGIVWVSGKLQGMVDEEHSDVDALRKKLLELQLRYEMDEISDAEYERLESEILDRLEAASNPGQPEK